MERLIRSKRKDPRSGERSYLRQQVERLIRSSEKIHALASVATRSYLRQQVERMIRSKRKDPRSGERSYRLGSKFKSSSSFVTVEATPSAGTSTFASQTSALSTTLRNEGSPQLS